MNKEPFTIEEASSTYHLAAENCGLRKGYKQTEVGVIPEDWDVGCVGNSFDVCNQLRLPISQAIRERMIGTYPYYGPTGIQGWINEYRIEGRYALIGEDGDHFLKWRTQSMTLMVQGKFNVNNHAHLVQGSKNLTDWFYWFFSNRDITNHLTRRGAGRYKLSKSTLINLPCSLPPLSEQRVIATALSDVDALLAKLDQLITKKRDLKQAAMQQLLTGQTRLPGFSGEWEIQTLRDECTLITKGTTPTSLGKNFTSSGINFIKIESLEENGKIIKDKIAFIDQDTNNLLKRSQLCENDILVSIAGALGRITVITSELLPANTNQALAIVRLKTAGGIDHGFLFYYLNSLSIKKYIEAINVQAAQANLSLENVGDFVISFPLLPEQIAIATVLSDMDAEITALEVRQDKTRDLKQGMMQELLTGRIRLI
jgi:type I restriction enzyme S subunit